MEKGNDTGAPLTLTTRARSRPKFIQYYWRQAIPCAAADRASVLQQNTGKQAAIVNILQQARARHGDSLAALMHKPAVWLSLARDVARVVQVIPLTSGRVHVERRTSFSLGL